MDRKAFLKTALLGGAVTVGGKAVAADKPLKSAGAASSKDYFPKKGEGFECSARVFEIGKPFEMQITLPEVYESKLKGLRLACIGENSHSMDGKARIGKEVSPNSEAFDIPFAVDGRKLTVKGAFAAEGQYMILFYNDGKTRAKTVFDRLPVYVLKRDLFILRPFKGDMHMHSKYSDGRDSIEDMAVKCLSLGFDFQGLSDHKRYDASADLQKKLAGVPISMKIFNAEEVHVSQVHVHNYGGTASVTDWVAKNREKFDARVAEILKTLPQDLAPEDARDVAETEAAFEVVRAQGGLATFNHPYWRQRNEFQNVSDSVKDTLLTRRNFDSVELVNGLCNLDGTDQAAGKLAELGLQGISYACVANSDAHNTDQLGTAYTIAFAPSCDFANIKAAILERKSVAVDARSVVRLSDASKNGHWGINAEEGFAAKTSPEVFGAMRYLRYALFLIENFYPAHDALCLEESKLLTLVLKGESSNEALAASSAKVSQNIAAFFAS